MTKSTQPNPLLDHLAEEIMKAQPRNSKPQFFAARAIKRGVTVQMMEANIKAGRPPHFIET